MTKEEFRAYAVQNKLFCGPHYVILANRTIQTFCIAADSYDTIISWDTPFSDTKYYFDIERYALLQKTTMVGGVR